MAGRSGLVVSSAWYRNASGDRYVVLPDGQTDLLFRRLDSGWQGHVVGPLSTAMVTPPAFGAVVGVRLALGAARALVGASLEEIAGRMVTLRELGIDGIVADEVLDAACKGDEGLTGLARSLTARADGRAPTDRRVRQAVHQLAAGGTTVHAVARAAGVTERQLLRLFREEVGITPKRFASLVRLRRALEDGRASGSAWASVAARTGYADESHLARECRRLTGMTPSLVERAMSDSFNAGHVLAAKLAGHEPISRPLDPD